MFGLQPFHLLIIIVVFLVILGPSRFPGVGSALVKAWRGFREALTGHVAEPLPRVVPAKPPWVIFLSSVMRDTAEERATAKRAFDKLPSLAHSWMFEEDSYAADKPVEEEYLTEVAKCDVFLLVLREEITPPVHKEFETARNYGKPRLVFLKRCERTLAAQAFVEKIRNELVYAEFDTLAQLENQILKAIAWLVHDSELFRKDLTEAQIAAVMATLASLEGVELARAFVETSTSLLPPPMPTSADQAQPTHHRIQVLEPEPPRIQVSEPELTRTFTKPAPPAPSVALKGRITFTVRRGNHLEDQTIHIMNTDGSNVKAILDRASDPAFSPDGSKIAYYRWTDGIFVAGGDVPPRKVIGGTDLGFPSWSHNGRWLAFSTRRRSEGRIEIVALDGSGRRYIAEGWAPAWSPDDTEIVFQSCLNGECGIYRLRLANAKITLITVDGGELPNWSPRRDEIVYQNEVDGQRQIFVINVDGADKKQLTFNSVHSSAAWSWDGNSIFYRSPEGGSWGIWIMRLDGTSPIKLIDNMPPGDLLDDRISVTL